MAGPLQGVVVLDLSRILAGPWATQVLADFGAEVIKIEHPRGGDDTRSWGPPYLKDEEGRETTESAYYLSANRGKHSVAVDIATAEGQSLVRRLAMQADVLVENFKVGGLARYGLAYDDLASLNPRLVYLSISAFGQDGPDAAEPGYDAMIQGDGRSHERHRRTGRRAGRRAAEGGGRRRGPDVRHVRGRRHPRGAQRASRLGPRPVHRPVAARHPGRMACEPEPELPRDGHAAAAARHGAPEHRPVPGVRARPTATSCSRSATTPSSRASAPSPAQAELATDPRYVTNRHAWRIAGNSCR